MVPIYVLNFEIHCEVVSPLVFTIELVFGFSASVTRLNLFFGCFLDSSRFFKEPAGIVCYAFEAFSRSCILLELKMISFLSKIFKLFFRVTGFAHLLRLLSHFYCHF